MKRNLFAIFLTLALVVALVFVVAPSAKAESYTFTETDREFSISEDSILDMAGFSGKVTLSNGAKLTVYDSGNTSKTGENVAQLTVEGDGSVEKITLQNGYRYLKVENTDGTYSFHPFNMAFTHIGLNTKTNSVCVRAAFIANDVVKAKLTDYGIYSTVHEEYASCAEKYPFNNANGVYAYYDFVDSFGTDDMDATKPIKLYMTVDGETIETEYTANIIPREVLKKVNKAGTSIANEPQLDRITDMIGGNDRIANILTNFRAEAKEVSLSFASTANRVSLDSNKQVWTVNGIIFTNDKASSTNAVTDYSAPVRLYQNSSITVTATNMTKIVFDCSGADYATALKNSIGTVSGATVTVSSDKVTVTFTNAVNSLTIAKLTAQVRLDAITVNATIPADCQHHGGTASCTEKAVCIDCEKEHGNLLPHNTISNATCTTPAQCSVCGTYGTVNISNHSYSNDSHDCVYGGAVKSDCVDENPADGACDICGATMSSIPVVVLEITKADFNTDSYAANNNTKTKNGYSYTSYQVMQQNSTMQWQKSKGYITIASNSFVALELDVGGGTFTVTVGGKTVSGTKSGTVTTYDLTGLSGQVKIAVGSATGKVNSIKFYK